MLWSEEWKAISSWIAGYLEAARIFFLSIPAQGSDFHAVSNVSFIPNAKSLKKRIEQFLENYSTVLSSDSVEVAETFLRNFKPEDFSGIHGVQGAALFLSEFRCEFDLSISSNEELARGLSERAFIHLQRTIVADPEFRKKWHSAFNSGELACERLGAIHLLLHGIWAFKAHAIGERTDLVLGERVNLEDVRSSNSVLVLTEWKIIRAGDSLENQARQAINQAKRYGVGALSGFELSTRRYLILVSEKNMKVPQDMSDDGILYRHINIAVNPDPPSVS